MLSISGLIRTAAAVVVLLVAGGADSSHALTKVKAGHLVALDMAPLFLAKEGGCFEKFGLDVETVFFANPGDNNAALAGGEIDFSTNPFTLPFFAANAGVPIRTIAAAGGWGIMQVIADGKLKINSVEDLKKHIMAGGKKLPELDALTMAYNAVQQGAAGVDMGRNIFQSEAPKAMPPRQAPRAVSAAARLVAVAAVVAP